MIKAIFFDLDDTLYQYEGETRIKVELDTIKHLAKMKNIPAKNVPELYLEFRKSFSKLIKKHNDDYPSLRSSWYKHFLIHLKQKNKKTIEKDSKKLDRFYWKTFSKIIKPYDDAAMVIPELAKKYKLYIITDGWKDGQNIRLKAIKLKKYFSGMVCSDDVGNKRKPHPDIFKKCLKIAKCQKNEAVMVGDKPKRDILGANNAGIISIWLKRGSYVKYSPIKNEIPSYKEDNFFEICNIVKK
ncbi:MAG: HAD family hydrolase, partial [Candidatus Woesearchaeota archaeon]